MLRAMTEDILTSTYISVNVDRIYGMGVRGPVSQGDRHVRPDASVNVDRLYGMG